MKKVVAILSITTIVWCVGLNIKNKIVESDIYKTTKEVVGIGKEFTDSLLEKDAFIENDLVKINKAQLSNDTGSLVVNFLLQNNSSNEINVALKDVKVNGVPQRIHETYDGRNSVEGNGEDLYASYTLLDVDLWDDSAWDKEFFVEGSIVIQDYKTRESLGEYKFDGVLKN